MKYMLRMNYAPVLGAYLSRTAATTVSTRAGRSGR
jgi:hypothetical protein